ncbi:hypothetical protein ARMSODRAFT_983324 [Armillaria solidipes]|uniref:Uncharacterized protein n=1 Tax=Armillaria solidipes TaxID=1076256 RepID=A0A2H3B5J2_9AGAR|nr:hypothetical protein ARMSODRAFT_983324 [Armillaria solidipes]
MPSKRKRKSGETRKSKSKEDPSSWRYLDKRGMGGDLACRKDRQNHTRVWITRGGRQPRVNELSRLARWSCFSGGSFRQLDNRSEQINDSIELDAGVNLCEEDASVWAASVGLSRGRHERTWNVDVRIARVWVPVVREARSCPLHNQRKSKLNVAEIIEQDSVLLMENTAQGTSADGTARFEVEEKAQ